MCEWQCHRQPPGQAACLSRKTADGKDNVWFEPTADRDSVSLPRTPDSKVASEAWHDVCDCHHCLSRIVPETKALSFPLPRTGFEDYGAYWRYNYETIREEGQYVYTRDQLMADVRSIYKEVSPWIWLRDVCLSASVSHLSLTIMLFFYLQIMPLYKELHAYVRAKLMEVYPGHIESDGPLPAHLLGM